MKIRTKMIVITSIAVLVAVMLINGVILQIVRESHENEAYIKACQNSYIGIQNFKELLGDVETGDTEVLSYISKKYQNDNRNLGSEFICIRTDGTENYPKAVEEIYNNTVLSADDLLKADYKKCEEDYSLNYREFSYGGREYLIFRNDDLKNLSLFEVEDVTYVSENIKALAGVLLMTSVGVMFLTVFVLSVLLHRVFLPFQKLKDSARQIAEGVYSQRVEIQKNDEVGELGESFNRMAEAVEARTRHLEESELRKTLFMGNLTHELKTPMTAISGYAQTLLRMKLSESEQEEALFYIYEECQRLERMSKKMMRLLELDSGEELQPQEVEVKKLFDAAEKSCKILLQEKQIQFVCMEQGERFLIDFDLMLDVMINLIDNAIKASSSGGKIIVSAKKDCISVEDFGRGIPKEEQEHIFEPFYMVDKSRSRKSGGAGLGLALTALIAKQHHIEIQIDSEEGRGTKIILQFVYNTMNT